MLKKKNGLLIIIFVILLCGVAHALNPVRPSKQLISLLDDIARGTVKNYSTTHIALLLRMGNKIDDFLPIINKYPIQEKRNILLEVLKKKDLVKSTEALVIKGRLAKGELKEEDLIKAIRSNTNIDEKSKLITKKEFEHQFVNNLKKMKKYLMKQL